MWGNQTGWIISAGIAVVFGWVLVMGALPASMETPTGTFAAVGLQAATLPIDPLTLFKPGTGGGDAGPIYRQAMLDYDQHQQQYADWADHPEAALAADPLGARKIVEARDCSKMDLFAKQPKELINYENDEPSLDTLHAVAHVTDEISLLAAQKNDLPKARRYAEALFALGYNLFRERVRWVEWNEGVTIMEWAALDMATADAIAHPDRAKALNDFNEKLQKYQTDKVDPLWKNLNAIDPQRYSGDIYQLAQLSNPEAMWRVEAILRLGRLTYFAPTRGDQLVARHYLARLASDTTLDPLTHTAAKEANDIITNEAKYNRIGLSSSQ